MPPLSGVPARGPFRRLHPEYSRALLSPGSIGGWGRGGRGAGSEAAEDRPAGRRRQLSVQRRRRRPAQRRQRLPSHGDLALPPPARAVGQRPVLRQGAHRAHPALPGAERAVGRGRGPGAVEVVQEGVHRLARHVAVDQRLGQAFGQVGGRSREPSRVAKVTVRGPSGPSATHTWRRPISSQVPSTSSPPGASRAHSRAQAAATSRLRRTGAARSPRGSARRGARPGAAGSRSRRAGRPAPRARTARRRRHPGRVDLDAVRPVRRGAPAQPLQQFHGGPGGAPRSPGRRRGRGGAAEQAGPVRGGDPAVHPPQPVRVGRPARDRPDGPGGGGRGACHQSIGPFRPEGHESGSGRVRNPGQGPVRNPGDREGPKSRSGRVRNPGPGRPESRSGKVRKPRSGKARIQRLRGFGIQVRAQPESAVREGPQSRPPPGGIHRGPSGIVEG